MQGVIQSAALSLFNVAQCTQSSYPVVTSSTDNGADISCGKLTRALLQVRPGEEVDFDPDGQIVFTITVSGKLPVATQGITIDGGFGCEDDPTRRPYVRLVGDTAPVGTNGLELLGNVMVKNIGVSGFKGVQIVAKGGNNTIKCSYAITNR